MTQTGFEDTRGIEYNNKIIKDIKNFLETYYIYDIKPIYFIFKTLETRVIDKFKYIFRKNNFNI